MSMQAVIHRHVGWFLVVLGLVGFPAVTAWSQEKDKDTPPPKQEAKEAERERSELEAQLIEARVRAECLEMELSIEKCRIERLMKAIMESELLEVMGKAEGPVIATKEKLEQARKLLEARKREYLRMNMERVRLERHRDELEARLDEVSGSADVGTTSHRLSELARRLDEALDSMNRQEGDASPKEHSRVSEVLRGIRSLLKAFEDDKP